jgi:hypothetical protein
MNRVKEHQGSKPNLISIGETVGRRELHVVVRECIWNDKMGASMLVVPIRQVISI